MDWNADMSTAPYQTPVIVLLENGLELLATLEPGASVAENGQECDQWCEVEEGTAPDCWSEGACWSSNAEEVASLQPIKWRPA